jgi:hypothetical protein
MPITIEPYRVEFIERVLDFNSRLLQKGYTDFRLPTDPRTLGAGFEGWLALDQGVVRGGYLLRKEVFSIKGKLHTVGFYNLSLSESVIDRSFYGVGVKMVLNAIKTQAKLFALGMGGLHRPLPNMLRGLGWSLHSVPFFFYCVRPNRVLRNLTSYRANPWWRILMDFAANTGVATVGLSLARVVMPGRATRIYEPEVDIASEFGSWADRLWEITNEEFGMIRSRTSAELNRMYPSSLQRIVRLKISYQHTVVGWTVVRLTKMHGHKQFGDLHVGTIVDCLAVPSYRHCVALGATRLLKQMGVDLIISNQSHRAWHGTLKDIGFLQGPSNYVFAGSKELSRLVDSLKMSLDEIHMSRGDGDGPINL